MNSFSRNMVERAEALMSDVIFDRQWCPPFFDPQPGLKSGVWRSNPPGYRIGFCTSTHREGVERQHASIRRSMADRPLPIWC